MSNLAKKLIEDMPQEDKNALRSWADDAYVIRNDNNLSKPEKLKKLALITKDNKVTIKFLQSVGKLIKKHTWDERKWPARMALVGLTLGGAVAGSKFAGVASAGMGVGVPVFLLSSAGGALLGTIIQETKK